jgi:hypothetical protein
MSIGCCGKKTIKLRDFFNIFPIMLFGKKERKLYKFRDKLAR